MRARSLAVFASLTLVASVALAGPSEPPPSGGCTSLREGAQAVNVRWRRGTSSRGCFFFSGPFDLGRDDHLGASAQMVLRGTSASLSFGRLRFEGSVQGDRVSVSRRSEHRFGGTWVVNEYIEGELTTVSVGGASCRGLRARYRYQERQEGRPPGQCTISAPLVVNAR